MSEEVAIKRFAPLMQSEVGYTPVTTTKGKACSSCRWFRNAYDNLGDDCQIVNDAPEPITPNGYCDRHELAPPLEPNREPMPVVIIEPAMGEEDSGMMSITPQKEGVVSKLINRLFGNKQDFTNPFTVFKAADGKPRWLATFSNNFEDRDGEIISEKAWDGWLKRVNMGLVPMPELWIGHIPGTKHGQADLVFAVGNFVVASGTFDATEEANAAVKYYTSKGRDTPLSHGFTFPKWAFKDGIYEVINTFEISTLPPPLVAANPFTEYEVIDMKEITPEQLAALEKVVGKDNASKIVTNLSTQSAKLQELGIAAKDFAEPDAITPAPVDDLATKAMADLVGGLVEGQEHLLNLLDSTVNATKAAQAKNDALEVRMKSISDQVALLTAKLGDKPRRASDAPETELSDAEKAALNDQLPVEYDEMFPGMKVPLVRK